MPGTFLSPSLAQPMVGSAPWEGQTQTQTRRRAGRSDSSPALPFMSSSPPCPQPWNFKLKSCKEKYSLELGMHKPQCWAGTGAREEESRGHQKLSSSTSLWSMQRGTHLGVNKTLGLRESPFLEVLDPLSRWQKEPGLRRFLTWVSPSRGYQ